MFMKDFPRNINIFILIINILFLSFILLNYYQQFENPETRNPNIKFQQTISSGLYFFKEQHFNFESNNDRILQAELTRYLSSVTIGCGQSERLGSTQDGGWNMCISKPFSFSSKCLVYSFGIANDWSFDDFVSKKYQCVVRAFDPSIKLPNHTRRENGSVVHFYNVGISGKDHMKGKWMLRTLLTLYNFLENNTKPTIDYLKMDVEGSELDAIPAMVQNGLLQKIKQIAFEVHPSSSPSTKIIKRISKVLQMIESAGFKKWSFHFNTQGPVKRSSASGLARPCCYEVVYVNTNYIDQGTVPLIDYIPENDMLS